MKNVALIGLGPHAKRIYYPYLELRHQTVNDIALKLVIDLESKKSEIQKYLDTFTLKPTKELFLPDVGQLNPESANPEVVKLLKSLGITHVIISTEPKSHKAYLIACVKAGLSVLVDKPVTAPINLMSIKQQLSEKAVQAIVNDSKELINLCQQYPKSRVLVQSQRRNHTGYNLVSKYLRKIVTDYQVPISYINIHHSDGMWNMPGEYHERENHPYKYGYGKLMHSGYHFIDLLLNIEAINTLAKDKRADKLTVFSQYVRPSDHLSLINNNDYIKLLKTDFSVSSPKLDMINYGELDSYSQLQFLKEGKILTTAQLSLIQTGFSQRAWAQLPSDAYKHNGRVRHELVSVHVGPLFNIQVHSYQAAEAHSEGGQKALAGGAHHFDVYIFKNSNLLGGKPFEVIHFGEQHYNKHKNDLLYQGHNEYARQLTLQELLDDKPSRSELQSHLPTITLMAGLYRNHGKQQRGQVPYSEFTMNQLTKGEI